MMTERWIQMPVSRVEMLMKLSKGLGYSNFPATLLEDVVCRVSFVIMT